MISLLGVDVNLTEGKTFKLTASIQGIPLNEEG